MYKFSNCFQNALTLHKMFILLFLLIILYIDLNILYIDLRVGFERTLYSVSESAGELVIPVRVLADDDGITPEVGLPLGVRVTSRDGSAVGTA